MSHRRRHHRFKLKSLYVWHRYIGLSAALLVVLLSITGIALNHTERFSLDHRFVRSTLLLDWYGIQPPKTAIHYGTANNSVTLMDRQLFLNTRPLNEEVASLTGFILQNDMIIVSQRDSILLLTNDGRLIERLGKNEGVPSNIERLGTTTEDRLLVGTPGGIYSVDADYLKWSAWQGDTDTITWSIPSPLAEDELLRLQRLFRGKILPWERVILDLHSGRIFGPWGPWLMDTAAILLLFLAGSGIFIWWKRQR